MFKSLLHAISLTLGLIFSSPGQTPKISAAFGNVAQQAFNYFARMDKQPDEFLRNIRLQKVTLELKLKALNLIPPESLVEPSAKGQAKLRALSPILKYHERDSFIELKIIRVPVATASFLAGAAILITEPALELLTTEELQAVVAHELSHEYYWNEFELARRSQQYHVIKELELRCDGIAVITLKQLGLNPDRLISATTKFQQYNERQGFPPSENYVSLAERLRFIQAMTKMIQVRNHAAHTPTRK